MTKAIGARTSTLSVRGFTLIELLIVVALIGILSAIAAPLLIAAKSSANEASAVQTLRTLVSAQSTFSNVCGSGAYTTSLTMLVTERFASPDLDITPKSGFSFELVGALGSKAAGADCTGQPTRTGFYFRAEPLAPPPAGVGLPPITSARSGRTRAASRRRSRSSPLARSRPSRASEPPGHGRGTARRGHAVVRGSA